MAGDGERLDESREPQVDGGRQTVERECRHGPRALERTRGIDSEELEVAADVAHALIGRCFAAGIERAYDHRVTNCVLVHARAELGNGAGHLVPDHLWRMYPVIHVTVRNMNVGAADAAVHDVEPHFARPGLSHLAPSLA